MYSECGFVNDVQTGSKHTTQSGGQAWDRNSKSAACMIILMQLYELSISIITCGY